MRRPGAQGCVAIAVSLLVMTCAASGKIIYVSPGQSADAEAIIIDHNCVDLSVIPDKYITRAAVLRVLMRHASVGQGIDWGLDCLAGNHPTNPACSGFPAGKYDRSNWVFELRGGNWRDKIDDLVTQTASRADEFDVFMTKLCYIDALGNNHPDWEYFRSRMEQLEADYPDKKFIWWTIPLTRDGQPGTDLFNAQMRAYCAANNKILFDIADIECHDPNGTKLTNAAGNEVISQNYTKEIHAGHLNPDGRVRVASAFWYLMARLAGWQEQLCTIQDAIDLASDGDTIMVADGIYTGPGNRNINFNGKSVTIRSENGPDLTIIDCEGQGYGFHIVGNTAGEARIEGFTIRHGVLGGIRCYGTVLVRAISPAIPEIPGVEAAHFPFDYAPVVIHNCKIVENPDGGFLIDSHDNVTIANCYIASNGTAGIYAYASAPTVRNCAVVKNHDAGIRTIRGGTISNCTVTENSGIGIWISQGTIVNSVAWSNGQRQLYNPDDNASVTYCDIQGGWPGEGNTDADPCFVPQRSGDYHLKSQAGRWDANEGRWTKDDVTSPCIDTGDPMSPIGHEPFPNGGRINMGAYGGTAEASKSYFGEPVCEVIVAGDINGDCIIDFKDFALMALHWLEYVGPDQGGWRLVEDNTEDAYSCEGNFDVFYPCSSAADEDWDTYALPADPGATSYIYEDYIIPSGIATADFRIKYQQTAQVTPGLCTTVTDYWNGNAWTELNCTALSNQISTLTVRIPHDALNSTTLQLRTRVWKSSGLIGGGNGMYYEGKVIWYFWPVCETIVAGDINGDCNVDFADFTIMAWHWLEDKN